VLLRKLGRNEAAAAFAEESIAIDPFNFGCHFERLLLTGAAPLQPARIHTYFEYALDYAAAGFYSEAAGLLKLPDTQHPMRSYYLGWCYARMGDAATAEMYFIEGSKAPADGCFPHRLEEIGILQEALRYQPADAKAAYYLGNLWYDKRQYTEAMDAWERSAAADGTFPTVFRNLSLAWFNKRGDAAKALECLRKAFELDDTDARVCMELDQLYRICNVPLEERLALLDKYPSLVASRDDLFLERISLHNQRAAFETARRMLASRKFHPWEGGEGKVVRQFMACHIGLAQEAIYNGQYGDALRMLEDCAEYPENLGEGKLYGAQENDRHYLLGRALQGAGQLQQAKAAFRLATEGIAEPVQAIFYNDPQPDKIFYQGLAWLQLDEQEKANAIFERLVNFANTHLNDHIRIDYFAVSLPDLLVFDQELDKRNRVHCLYLKALGYLGLGQYPEANRFFNEGLALDAYHEGIHFHQRMIPFMKQQQKTVLP
jgi:tetratricopeptide (TPR) repeat protein